MVTYSYINERRDTKRALRERAARARSFLSRFGKKAESTGYSYGRAVTRYGYRKAKSRAAKTTTGKKIAKLRMEIADARAEIERLRA